MSGTCSGCGIILNRHNETEGSHCSMHDLYAINGFFTCCVCAKNEGWRLFESSACVSCKNRQSSFLLQKDSSNAASIILGKEYPALARVRENSSTPFARSERFEQVQARVRHKVLEKLNPKKDTDIVSTRRTSSISSMQSSTSSKRRERRLKAITPEKRGEQSD
mmetsp:Transcript_7972/g.18183  ORF Transcript_7972/g.18183 Transcript_7972/m.18183 type:complete len:164 (-) Transcript_7972:405-896(-)